MSSDVGIHLRASTFAGRHWPVAWRAIELSGTSVPLYTLYRVGTRRNTSSNGHHTFAA